MKKAFDYLEKVLTFLASFCLAVFSITTFLQVVLRSFEIPIVWAEEVARFSFIYMVFLGSAVGVRKGAHYSFDLFEKAKNKTVARVAKIIVLLCESAFLAFLFYTSLRFIPQMARRASSILRIPTSIPYASIVVFSGVGLLFVLEKIIDFIRQPKADTREADAGEVLEERGIAE